jgi:hypothetical protein
LRAATATARGDASRITVTATSVEQHGRSAVVVVEVRGPDGGRTADLHLERRGGDWVVLRAAGACAEVTCFSRAQFVLNRPTVRSG